MEKTNTPKETKQETKKESFDINAAWAKYGPAIIWIALVVIAASVIIQRHVLN